MATRIGSLIIRLGLDSGTFKSGLTQSQKDMQRAAAQFKKFGLAIASAFGGAALGMAELTRRTIDTADELSKAAASTGIAIEELSRLAYAADLSGVSFEQLQSAVGRLSRNMFDASQGTGAAGRAFAALGVAVRNGDGTLRSATEVMLDIAGRFEGMRDGAEKTALAMQVFGRAGAEMIPLLNGGRDGLRELTTEADRFGVVIDAETGRKAEEFNDNLSRLQGVFSATAARLAAELLPHLVDFTNWLIANRVDIDRAITKFGEFIDGAVRLGRNIAAATSWMEERFGAVFRAVAIIINPLQRLIGLVSGFGRQRSGGPVAATAQGMLDLGTRAMNTAREFARLGPQAEGLGAALGRSVGGGARNASAALRQVGADAEATARRLQSLVDRAFPDLARLRELQADRAFLEAQRGLDNITPEVEAAVRFTIGTSELERAPDVSDFIAGGNQVLGVVGQIEEAAARMGDELAKALEPVPDRFAELRLAGGQAFAELGNQLSGVLQGAQSLGEALRNVVAQLADMAINLAFRALGGSLGIPGFASGTLSAPRGLALVGEQGPELVRFSGGERVFDNSATRQMMGGGSGMVNHFVINAPNERVGRETAGQAAMRFRQVLNGR